MIKVTNFHGLSSVSLKQKVLKSKDTRAYERWLCIHFSMEGLTVPEISKMLFRNENTIREWIESFNSEGERGLKRESPPGSEKKNN